MFKYKALIVLALIFFVNFFFPSRVTNFFFLLKRTFTNSKNKFSFFPNKKSIQIEPTFKLKKVFFIIKLLFCETYVKIINISYQKYKSFKWRNER